MFVRTSARSDRLGAEAREPDRAETERHPAAQREEERQAQELAEPAHDPAGDRDDGRAARAPGDGLDRRGLGLAEVAERAPREQEEEGAQAHDQGPGQARE